MKHIALAALALCACSEQELIFVQRTPEPAAEAQPAAETQPEAEPELVPVRELLLNPEPALLDATKAAADSLQATFGLRVRIAPEGIPLMVVPRVHYNGGVVDAFAGYARHCTFDECNDPKAGVAVQVGAFMLPGDSKAWALEHTVLHEVTHIVSGWGGKLPMHVGEMAGVMAPGCRGGSCPGWSEADAELVCANAPCEFVAL